MHRVILHIPHSSTNIPFREGYVALEEQIQNEILNDKDLSALLFFEKAKNVLIDDVLK